MGKGFYLKLWVFIFLLLVVYMPSRPCNAVQVVASGMEAVFSNPVGGIENDIDDNRFITGEEQDLIRILIFNELLFTGPEALTQPSDIVHIGYMQFSNSESVFDTGASQVDLTITGTGVEEPQLPPVFTGSITLQDQIMISHETNSDIYTFSGSGLTVTVPEGISLEWVEIFGQLLPPNSPMLMNFTNFIPSEDSNIDVGQVVPEPATIALLGIGLVGLAGGAVRRKFKKKRISKQ